MEALGDKARQILDNLKEVLAKCVPGNLGEYDLPKLAQIWVAVEYKLQEVGREFFQKNPSIDRAPYAVYAIHDTVKKTVTLDVRVGTDDVQRGRSIAYAEMVTGELVRQIVRHDV